MCRCTFNPGAWRCDGDILESATCTAEDVNVLCSMMIVCCYKIGKDERVGIIEFRRKKKLFCKKCGKMLFGRGQAASSGPTAKSGSCNGYTL